MEPREKLNLYGVLVDAGKYERVKRLADALIGETPAGCKPRDAKKYCVQVAEMAIRQVRQHYGLEDIGLLNL